MQKNASYFEWRQDLHQYLQNAVELAGNYYEINMLKDLDATHQEMCEYHYNGQPLCIEPCALFHMPEFQCFIKRKITAIQELVRLEKEEYKMHYPVRTYRTKKIVISGLAISTALASAALLVHAGFFCKTRGVAYFFDAAAAAATLTTFFYAYQTKEIAKVQFITDDEAIKNLLVKKYLKI